MFVCYVNVIFWLCMPIIRSAYIYKCSDYVNKIMEFIYPFDYSTSPVYEITVLYECVVMIVFFMVLVSQDLLFVVFISIYCGQIEAIKSSISALKQKFLKIALRMDKYNKSNNMNYRNCMKTRLVTVCERVGNDRNGDDVFYNEDHYNFLIEIIKDHQKLMK